MFKKTFNKNWEKKIDETQKKKATKTKNDENVATIATIAKTITAMISVIHWVVNRVFDEKNTSIAATAFFHWKKKQHVKSKRMFANLNASQNDSLLLAQRFENNLKQNQTRNHDFRHQRNNRIFLSRFQNWKFTTNVRWINEQTSNTSTTSNVFNSSC